MISLKKTKVMHVIATFTTNDYNLEVFRNLLILVQPPPRTYPWTRNSEKELVKQQQLRQSFPLECRKIGSLPPRRRLQYTERVY